MEAPTPDGPGTHGFERNWPCFPQLMLAPPRAVPCNGTVQASRAKFQQTKGRGKLGNKRAGLGPDA